MARTIAHLDGAPRIDGRHVAEALRYRPVSQMFIAGDAAAGPRV